METSGVVKLDERLAQIERQITDFKESLQIPNHNIESTVELYLTAGQDEIRRMQPREHDEAALLLGQYSFYLQSNLNKLHAMVVWAESNLNSIIMPMLSQYNCYNHEEKRQLAIRDNVGANKLEKFKIETTLKKNLLYQLADKVDKIAKFYSDLSKSVRYRS